MHVLSCSVLLKSVLLISCVFWIFFSERWQTTLFQIFLRSLVQIHFKLPECGQKYACGKTLDPDLQSAGSIGFIGGLAVTLLDRKRRLYRILETARQIPVAEHCTFTACRYNSCILCQCFRLWMFLHESF